MTRKSGITSFCFNPDQQWPQVAYSNIAFNFSKIVYQKNYLV